ncbi:MAG: carboxypeptidase regulatory-like domain-containing protein, partial [Acidobacteria bacterium]
MPIKRYSFILMGIFVVLGGLAAKPASAQELATLTVTVEDEAGAVIVGAQVALINQATGARRTAQTNDRGLVVISAIPPGRYRLTVSAEGFAEQSLDVQLTVGQ